MAEHDQAPGPTAAETAVAREVSESPEAPAQIGQASDPIRSGLSDSLKLLLALACVTVVIYGMRFASGILSPVFMALFIVMAMMPLIRWMRSRRVPNWATLVIMLVFLIVVGLLFISVLAVSARQLSDKLPVYEERLGTLFTSVDQWFSVHGINTSGLLNNVLSADKLVGMAKGLISGLYGAFSNVLLMFLIVLFMISEVFQFPEKIHARFGTQSKFAKAVAAFSQDTRSYLFIKTWISALTAVIMTIVFYALGVDFPLLWGMLFFLLSYVPNIGFVVSVIPPFMVTLLEHGFVRAAVLFIVVLVVNAIFDNAISPRIMGRGAGLTTLSVFLSLVFWAWVFGPVGALISVPLTIMVKRLFLEIFPETQFLAEAVTPAGHAVDKARKRRARSPD